MTRIKRLSDGVLGWALQMAGAFVFDGRRYPARHWVIEVHGKRSVVPTEDLNSQFMPLVRF